LPNDHNILHQDFELQTERKNLEHIIFRNIFHNNQQPYAFIKCAKRIEEILPVNKKFSKESAVALFFIC